MRNKLFVQPGCPHCAEARAYLNARESVFVEYDIAADRRALGLLATLTGRTEVPTLVSGYQAIIGFNRERWALALRHGSDMEAHDPSRLPESLGPDPYDDE